MSLGHVGSLHPRHPQAPGVQTDPSNSELWQLCQERCTVTACQQPMPRPRQQAAELTRWRRWRCEAAEFWCSATAPHIRMENEGSVPAAQVSVVPHRVTRWCKRCSNLRVELHQGAMLEDIKVVSVFDLLSCFLYAWIP